MKKLIKNYINLLSFDKVNNFLIKNDIHLNETELNYLLNIIKNNYEDIINNEEKYLNNIKNNINYNDYIKLKDLYFYYKNKYKNYLF